ncbi:ROK family protein [Planctomicrobium sp. SH661]|uniref:ROK family transcriptional regulator n=1 Tax=Planctomicrobium sp. SH661 TaxID=3448124 RepID=UPI003F5AF431
MSARIEPKLLRKLNERRVLELIQQQGPLSRAAISRLSGLSAPTISKAVASLLDVGLLEESDAQSSTFGRPAKLIRLAMVNACVLGVVIEPDLCWIVAASLDGQLDTTRTCVFNTPESYTELLDKIELELRALKDTLQSEVRGIGMTVPGLKHQSREEVLFSPNLHILDGKTPGKDIAARMEIQCVVLQESHALCVGERMFGDAQGQDNFAMLDISTGLGLGVMSGGRILTGHSGLAGELGHMTVDPQGMVCGCGNRGCLETLATDAALARSISLRLGRNVEISEAVQSIRGGELDAAVELEQVAEYLAIAFAAVINIFNPSALFVHGVLFSATDELFPRVLGLTQQRALKPSLAECRIVQARGSKRHAAVAGIIQHLTQSWAPTLS